MVESIYKNQNIMGRALGIAIVIATLVVMSGGSALHGFSDNVRLKVEKRML